MEFLSGWSLPTEVSLPAWWASFWRAGRQRKDLEVERVFGQLRQSMEAMHESMKDPLCDNVQLLNALSAFQNCSNPTKRLLRLLAEERCDGLPAENKGAHQKIASAYENAFFETLQYTASLRRLLQSRRCEIELLKQAQSADADEFTLEAAAAYIEHSDHMAGQCRRHAKALIKEWADLGELIRPEIVKLQETLQSERTYSDGMLILMGLSGVAVTILVGSAGVMSYKALAAAKLSHAFEAQFKAKGAEAVAAKASMGELAKKAVAKADALSPTAGPATPEYQEAFSYLEQALLSKSAMTSAMEDMHTAAGKAAAATIQDRFDLAMAIASSAGAVVVLVHGTSAAAHVRRSATRVNVYEQSRNLLEAAQSIEEQLRQNKASIADDNRKALKNTVEMMLRSDMQVALGASLQLDQSEQHLERLTVQAKRLEDSCLASLANWTET